MVHLSQWFSKSNLSISMALVERPCKAKRLISHHQIAGNDQNIHPRLHSQSSTKEKRQNATKPCGSFRYMCFKIAMKYVKLCTRNRKHCIAFRNNLYIINTFYLYIYYSNYNMVHEHERPQQQVRTTGTCLKT